MTSRRFALVAVVLPLLAIAFAIVRSEVAIRGGRVFVLEIEGYDPRDLLRGHYLQFRLRTEVVPREPCGDVRGSHCCLCVVDDGAIAVLERATCDTARRECDAALPAALALEPLRYYVPEARAAELERRLVDAGWRRAAHAVLAVRKDGDVTIRELRIDGEPITGDR